MENSHPKADDQWRVHVMANQPGADNESCFVVSPMDPAASLRERYAQEHERQLVDSMRLLFQGKIIDNDTTCTLVDCGIGDGAKVMLVGCVIQCGAENVCLVFA